MSQFHLQSGEQWGEKSFSHEAELRVKGCGCPQEVLASALSRASSSPQGRGVASLRR